MRFKSGGDRIGELLDVRGRHGIKTRVLIWKNALANFVENTIIGDGLAGAGRRPTARSKIASAWNTAAPFTNMNWQNCAQANCLFTALVAIATSNAKRSCWPFWLMWKTN
ncbi:hypothetical protein [Pseudomonas fluorescens]|uniref:hypothetical protein n=1 Tax=Pseudomonas fluorescens TaxID=294 RepID=UPI00123F6C51|nr:hypothetical protein [Pseudomonas fluorescens]